MGKPKTILTDQKGSYLIIMTALILFLSFCFVGMVELGKILIVKEQTQTATDSAALAAAGTGVKKWVEIDVFTDMGSYESCDDDGCSCYNCGTTTAYGIQGTEEVLIKQAGWKAFCAPYCSCGGGSCKYTLREEWLTYDMPVAVSSNGNTGSIDKDMYIDKIIEYIARAIYSSPWASWQRAQLVEALSGMTLEQLITFSVSNQKGAFIDWYFEKTGLDQAKNNCQSSQCKCDLCKEDGVQCYQEAVPATSEEEGATCLFGTEYCTKYICYKDWGSCVQARAGMANAERYHRLLCGQRGRILQMIQMYEDNESYTNTPFSGSTAQMAQTFFTANLPENAEEASIEKIHSYQGYDQRNNPFYPSVVVYAKAKIRPFFTTVFGEDNEIKSCSQASTYFKKHSQNKWIRPPEDACWEDW